MDHIRKAILKAKAARRDGDHIPAPSVSRRDAPRRHEPLSPTIPPEGSTRLLKSLDPALLERNRIVAHLPHSPYTIGFDVLRTKVYQTMMERGWRTLVITSPTPDSGKTVTSINLAISLARQPGCFTVLVDCDFRKPSVARYLGLQFDADLHDVLSGRHALVDAIEGLKITGDGLGIIATRNAIARPSEVLSSPEMKGVVSAIKALSPDTLVIFDAPPMLIADDVLAFLPEVDGVLLVVSPDWTNYSDTEACLRNIPEEKLIGTVLARSNERTEQSYYVNYKSLGRRR